MLILIHTYNSQWLTIVDLVKLPKTTPDNLIILAKNLLVYTPRVAVKLQMDFEEFFLLLLELCF